MNANLTVSLGAIRKICYGAIRKICYALTRTFLRTPPPLVTMKIFFSNRVTITKQYIFFRIQMTYQVVHCTSSCKRFDSRTFGLTVKTSVWPGTDLNLREKTSNSGDEFLRSGEGKKECTNHMVSSKSRTSVRSSVQAESTSVLPESDLGGHVFRC
jgi:hypothetical protein